MYTGRDFIYLFICLEQREDLQLQETYTMDTKHEYSTNTEKQNDYILLNTAHTK
jgi:hypothetical protein